MTTIFFSLLGKQSRVLAISSNKSSEKKPLNTGVCFMPISLGVSHIICKLL